jgi:hypothetical protein
VHHTEGVPQEFREDVIRVYRDSDSSVAQVAKDFGVSRRRCSPLVSTANTCSRARWEVGKERSCGALRDKRNPVSGARLRHHRTLALFNYTSEVELNYVQPAVALMECVRRLQHHLFVPGGAGDVQVNLRCTNETLWSTAGYGDDATGTWMSTLVADRAACTSGDQIREVKNSPERHPRPP